MNDDMQSPQSSVVYRILHCSNLATCLRNGEHMPFLRFSSTAASADMCRHMQHRLRLVCLRVNGRCSVRSYGKSITRRRKPMRRLANRTTHRLMRRVRPMWVQQRQAVCTSSPLPSEYLTTRSHSHVWSIVLRSLANGSRTVANSA